VGEKASSQNNVSDAIFSEDLSLKYTLYVFNPYGFKRPKGKHAIFLQFNEEKKR